MKIKITNHQAPFDIEVFERNEGYEIHIKEAGLIRFIKIFQQPTTKEIHVIHNCTG